MDKLPCESLATMEILAAFDPDSFQLVAEATTNLMVVPVTERDPMNRAALDEDVTAIASAMGTQATYTEYERELKGIAEQYGNFVL